MRVFGIRSRCSDFTLPGWVNSLPVSLFPVLWFVGVHADEVGGCPTYYLILFFFVFISTVILIHSAQFYVWH